MLKGAVSAPFSELFSVNVADATIWHTPSTGVAAGGPLKATSNMPLTCSAPAAAEPRWGTEQDGGEDDNAAEEDAATKVHGHLLLPADADHRSCGPDALSGNHPNIEAPVARASCVLSGGC